MHRLTWLVGLLILGMLAFGAGALATVNAPETRMAALTFAVGAVSCLAQACVIGTLIAIERKIDRIVVDEPAPPGRDPKERRAIRASLPPRADGRL